MLLDLSSCTPWKSKARLLFVFWTISIKIKECGRCEQYPNLGRDEYTTPFMADALGIPRKAV